MQELQQTPHKTKRRKSKGESPDKKSNMNLQEDDIVLCTVKRTEGTTVFLEIEDNGEGTMTFSEVSPGRIRNIREYVAPNKKIVCKILRIKEGNPQLSLRRVTAKERDEVLDHHKRERILANIIKPILKEKTPEVLKKIKEKYELSEFLTEARENPKLIEKWSLELCKRCIKYTGKKRKNQKGGER